jgi:hypothetical protein
MVELELTRSPDDRRLYRVGALGSLRLGGFFARSATGEAGGVRWTFRRRGILGRRIEASDASGALAGAYDARGVRRGGTLHWGGRELVLRPASAWRERYALVAGEREIAILDGKGWGRRPVAVRIDDPSSLDPGLLLFAVFVVHVLAEDAGGSAGGAAAASGGAC